MTTDATETIRRFRLVEINGEPAERETLEHRHGQVWDSRELARDFIVIGFIAPYAIVRCRSNGFLGSLEFQHHPRFYFNWEADG